MKNCTNSTQSRRFLITFNNPDNHGVTYQLIEEELCKLSSLRYFCISTEIGANEGTKHFHVFVIYDNPKKISSLKNLKNFCTAHIESANGKNEQCRDYVFKLNKYANSEKGSTRVEGTQKEWGIFPQQKSDSNSKMAKLIQLVEEGISDYELIKKYPEFVTSLQYVDRLRMIIEKQRFGNVYREVEVIYIFGKTGTGKTRGVMEAETPSRVCRVVNYEKNALDEYAGHEVLLLDEYNENFSIQFLLTLLEGYPREISKRYNNRMACYTKVYIISNIPLEHQYRKVQRSEPEVFRALLRRISRVIWYEDKDKIHEFESGFDYWEKMGFK